MAENVSIKCNIKFNEPVKAFALTKGGWFPLAFTPSPFVLVDRNVVSILSQIGRVKDRGDHRSNKWWFEFINSPSYTLNPVLSAMEGNSKRTPTYEEFVSAFKSDSQLLAEKLPKSKLINYEEKHFKVAYEIIDNLSQRHQLEIEFLIDVSSIVAERTATHKIKDLESKIIEYAQNHNLSLHSFVVLAVLSCLYEHQNGSEPSIGKKLLKPSKSYTKETAYNALSDLRCLEFLTALHALFSDSISFITRDRALAAFWCALNPKNHLYNNNTLTYDVELKAKLFPRLSDKEIDELKCRLDKKFIIG